MPIQGPGWIHISSSSPKNTTTKSLVKLRGRAAARLFDVSQHKWSKECKDLGRNRFLFTFHEEASKKKALENGPWMFNKNLLVIEDFVPSNTIDEYDFKMIPIWVKVYGIPMGMMSMETGDLVGEQIEVLHVDLDDDGNAMGEFMRIIVRMDITIPIMRFAALELEEDEED